MPIAPLYNLSEHPELAALIGQISSEWAAIEYKLSHLFTWMIGASPPQGQAAFFELQNNKARRDMMRGLIPWLHTTEEREAVTDILSRTAKIANIRNRYCHSPWARSDDGTKLYIMLNIGSKFPYGDKLLIRYQDVFNDGLLVVNFSSHLGKQIKALTDKRPLLLNPEALPQSYRKKFDGQLGRRMTTFDLPHQATLEEPVPQLQPSDPSPQSDDQA